MPSVHVPRASQQPPQFMGPHRPMPSQSPPPPGSAPQVVPWAVQFSQACPLAPHAVPSVPIWHLSPTQQPAQLVASHLVPPHTRSLGSHACPLEPQSTQAPAPVPHARASVPGRHTWVPPVVTQQPDPQLVASQVATFLPHALRVASQVSNPEPTQSVHFPPRFPQACTSVPTRHTPLASQQPVGHVLGPQAAASGRGASTRASTVAPPSRMASSRLERPHPVPADDVNPARPATKRAEVATRAAVEALAALPLG